MKKCPVCNQTFTWRMLLHRKFSQSFPNLLGEHLTDGKGVIRCPHCGSRLRKKISFIFFLALTPFLISAGVYMVSHQYSFLMILSVAFFLFIYINLPYVPYDT